MITSNHYSSLELSINCYNSRYSKIGVHIYTYQLPM